MSKGAFYFHGGFASASLGFVLLSACLGPHPAAATANNTAGKREAANAQFARAQEMRAALNEKPGDKRTLADYKRVVTTYQHVSLITPRAPEVPDSLVAVGELNTEMGDRFGRTYYQSAAEAYEFLIREYPANKYVPDAMLRMAQLQKDQLGDSAAAAKTYQDFLKKYPRSAHKREVQVALADLSMRRNAESGVDAKAATAPQQPTPAPAKKEPAAQTASRETNNLSDEAPAGKTESPRIQHIRCSATPDGTEVVIDLEDAVQYISGRIANPDRIYFDLSGARLSPALLHKKIQATGDLLSQVRVAQRPGGLVRVVLDVNGVKDYAASLMRKPTRLVIELYGPNGPRNAPVQSAKAATSGPSPENSTTAQAPKTAANDATASNDLPVNINTANPPVAEEMPTQPAPHRASRFPLRSKFSIPGPTKPPRLPSPISWNPRTLPFPRVTARQP